MLYGLKPFDLEQLLRVDVSLGPPHALCGLASLLTSRKEVLGRGKAFVHFTSGEGKETSVVNEVYENALVAKKLIEMVVPDEAVDSLIQLVLSVNSHGTEGDGKIFVLPVEESIRIHTGETGEDALV